LRPGRPDDFPALLALWAEDVRRGGHDCVPDRTWLRRQMDDFDWAARTRVMGAGAPQGMVVVLERQTDAGPVARVETVARSEPVRLELMDWGLRLSRAAGAVAAQVWWPRDVDPAKLDRFNGNLNPLRSQASRGYSFGMETGR
jgi:hypothetical protein